MFLISTSQTDNKMASWKHFSDGDHKVLKASEVCIFKIGWSMLVGKCSSLVGSFFSKDQTTNTRL